MSDDLHSEADEGHEPNVVPLGREVVPRHDEPTRPRGRIHQLAIIAMSMCAVLGILATLAFITVAWPRDSGRYVIAVLIVAIVGFIASASIAVLSAARDTYVRHHDESY